MFNKIPFSKLSKLLSPKSGFSGSLLLNNQPIAKIPNAKPKSPTLFTIKALIAAEFAAGFLYQKPISKYEANPTPVLKVGDFHSGFGISKTHPSITGASTMYASNGLKTIKTIDEFIGQLKRKLKTRKDLQETIMKITKKQLKNIIREEYSRILSEGQHDDLLFSLRDAWNLEGGYTPKDISQMEYALGYVREMATIGPFDTEELREDAKYDRQLSRHMTAELCHWLSNMDPRMLGEDLYAYASECNRSHGL